MRHGLTATTLAIVASISACSGGSGGGAESALEVAVERTLKAEGFHIEGRFTFEGETIQAEGDYRAPDRMLITSSGGAARTTTIIVGNEYFSSEPEVPDSFSLWEMPCDVGVDIFIPALAVVRHAEDVTISGDTLAFQAEGNEGSPIEGEAHVEDGYLVGLTLRYTVPRINEPVEERWIFSTFGATVAINPPPASQVLENSGFEGNPPIVASTRQPPTCP